MTLRGAIYGSVLYDQATYGRPSDLDASPQYSASPFVATALDYYRIQLTWGIPVAGGSLQLVRNNYSASFDQNDGIVLIPSQPLLSSPMYVDNTLSISQQGSFQYYTLWNQDDTGFWWRAADVQALLPKNWGYGDRLFSLIPQYYQDADFALATIIPLTTDTGAGQGAIEAFSTVEGGLTETAALGGTVDAASTALGDITSFEE